jgi:glyoxylase I family protein
MRRQRREILRMVPLAIGASALLGNDDLSAVAQAAESAKNSPAASETELEKVSGIGGFFFRAHDPKGLAQWYQEHLGVLIIPTSYAQKPWQQEAGATAFAPFPETTKYFGDPAKQWMINFRVNNLEKMAAQLKAAGIEVTIDSQTYPNGRFARLKDPEGNPIQLWQPA